MKRIFTSQNSLNLSRRRPKRILEALVDSPQNKNTQNVSLSKPLFNQTGGTGSADTYDKTKIECPHYEHCNVRLFGRINCITDYKDCQTYKFYQRYGI